MSIAGKDTENWVFGYGSLMWRPDFTYRSAATATLEGWQRQLCIRSTLYRGTPHQPGLVLGLIEGRSCQGIAFSVTPEHWPLTVAKLYDREMIDNLYQPSYLSVTLHDGRQVKALTFIARPDHKAFWQGSTTETITLIKQGTGTKGTCLDYFKSTCEYLNTLNIEDHYMMGLLKELE